MAGSGYTDCRCRDCFEIAVSNDTDNPDFCHECETAGCESDSECCVDRGNECEHCGDDAAGLDAAGSLTCGGMDVRRAKGWETCAPVAPLKGEG